MFGKILIANRGEIACRIIRTARRMGIATVAVYSEADARALHVEMADEKVAIGPAAAAQSYLSIDKIIAACQATGAQAVHPGYGFLSERAEFASALEAAGIVFIGPNAKAIAAMGDKIESKKRAKAAGVSTVPGHLEAVADETEAVKIAEGVGYPVMLKASAGGGGKGMRIAHRGAEVREGLARARSEAKSSFGDDRVFIEKFIENPRHIEIQVLGDKHGNVIHLGERECSIQRRNQKVIEESPSPLLDAKTRRAMGEQAVALAKAVGYDSAGTVEFVAGQDRSFYFLEMNTRLQVEHPVTELVTGLDLVELMIRVAAGEKLPLAQKDVTVKGWAVEARIYAEDPARGFVPSVGRLVRYRPPTENRALRNDTGVGEGGEISIHYDPMIAKLCAHGPDRASALAALSDGLDQFVIDGIRHNIAFLASIMAHPRWRRGELSTGFIAEEFPGGFKGAAATPELLQLLAIVAAALDHIETRRRWKPAAPERVVKLGSEWLQVTVDADGGRHIEVGIDGGKRIVITSWVPGTPVFSGSIDGDTLHVQVRPVLNGYRLMHHGLEIAAHVFTGREAELARLMPERSEANGSKQLHCPMPGRVVSIAVAAGQEVKAGETLAVVEAMKMENVLRAERDGMVKTVHVKPGDTLAVDAVILEFA